MRSNSGKDESRNNMRDPTMRERSMGRGTIKSDKEPKAPADHRQGQNRQEDDDRQADRDLGKELRADDSSPEHHDERERHSGNPVQDRIPVEEPRHGIPRQADPGEGTEVVNAPSRRYSCPS